MMEFETKCSRQASKSSSEFLHVGFARTSQFPGALICFP